MTVTVLILTIFCIEAGHTSEFLENHPIITINTLQLRLAYEAKYGQTPAIRDVYNVHIKTFCFADYPPVAGAPLVNLACTAPSTYCKLKNFQIDLSHFRQSFLGLIFLTSEIRTS
jgi:hypothetical protein